MQHTVLRHHYLGATLTGAWCIVGVKMSVSIFQFRVDFPVPCRFSSSLLISQFRADFPILSRFSNSEPILQVRADFSIRTDFEIPSRFCNSEPILQFRDDFAIPSRFCNSELIFEMILRELKNGLTKIQRRVGHTRKMFFFYSRIRFYFHIGLGNTPLVFLLELELDYDIAHSAKLRLHISWASNRNRKPPNKLPHKMWTTMIYGDLLCWENKLRQKYP